MVVAQYGQPVPMAVYHGAGFVRGNELSAPGESISGGIIYVCILYHGRGKMSLAEPEKKWENFEEKC